MKFKTILILIFFTILRIFLITYIPIFLSTNMGYDDVLMVNQAESLIDGNWLGEYDDKTLTKGFFYPFFIATCNKLHIKYSVGSTILYVLASILFIYSIHHLVKRKGSLIFYYLLLLYNPISFAFETYQKLYRNSIVPALTIIIFSLIILLIKHKDSKKGYIISFLVGLILFIMYNNRQDMIWIAPSLVLLAIALINKSKTLKSIMPLFIIFITFIIGNTIISTKNYLEYGLYTTNELEKSSFKKTFLELSKIKSKNIDSQISKETLDKVAKTSETFNNLYTKEKQIELYTNWTYKSSEIGKEINNGFLIWALRSMVDYTNGAQAAEQTWKDIYAEIEDEKFEKRFILNNVYLVPPRLSYIPIVLKEVPKNLKYIITYENVIPKINTTYRDEDIVKLARKVTNDTILYHSCSDEKCTISADDYIYSKNLLLSISNLYSLMIPILFIISIVIFIYNIIKKKNILLECMVISSFILIFFGVTYTDCFYVDAANYFYFAPIYSVLIIFIILSLKGVDLHEIINNNTRLQ